MFLDLNGVSIVDPEGTLYGAMIADAERRLDKAGLASAFEGVVPRLQLSAPTQESTTTMAERDFYLASTEGARLWRSAVGRRVLILLAVVVPAIATPGDKFTVSGFGAYPTSRSMTSMWLAGPDRRPLLMGFFHGPDGWHDTHWKVDSKFEKGKPGWAELQSDKATLRLCVDTATGEAEVQSRKFQISEANTFLVLHAAEPGVPEKIVALGSFDLPASREKQPASVLLLQSVPGLMERINEEIAADQKERSKRSR